MTERARDRLTALFWFAYALAVGLVIGAAVAAARAPADVPIDPLAAQWFRSLQNPETGAYCCDAADGHVLAPDQWRMRAGRYEVWIDGAFRAVDADAVLAHVANPMGAPVAFWIPGTRQVLCFVRAPDA